MIRVTFNLVFRHVLVLLMLVAPAAATRGGVVTSMDVLAQTETFASNSMFAPVGWLAGVTSGGNVYAGSAVLIAPQWVLTAGHVVDDGWLGMKFSLSPSIFGGPPNYSEADQWFTTPDYGGGATGFPSGSDLGLVHLSQPITSVQPAPLFRGSDQIGTEFYSVGYGRPGIAGVGLMTFDGIKRAGTNTVFERSAFPLGSTSYLFSEFNIGSTLLEMQDAPNDSGKPYFNLSGEVIGIASHIIVVGNYENNSTSAATSVSRYASYLDSMTAVPEVSSIWLLLMAGSLVAATHRARSRRQKP